MYDPISQLSYLNARFLDPVRGQFLSQDAVFLSIGSKQLPQISDKPLTYYLSDPQQLNSYSYGRDNPIIYSDPNGLDIYWRSDGTLARNTRSGFNQYFESQDVSMLNRNASLMENNRWNLSLFNNQVTDNGSWDYKTQGREYYFFDGKLVKADEFGNLNFGYTGTAGGIGSSVLVDAGGYVEVRNQTAMFENIGNNFEKPEDVRSINQGVQTYYKNNGNNSSANISQASNVVYQLGLQAIARALTAISYILGEISQSISNKIN
ncbi:MAG: hypothetical protein A2664_03270 [Candidatus Taylorbacteria bacterium RIFCSPHIGHO2_01_FULL_46_22b]|uniref:Bacterial toxin 44 domain-containing protein n=1 Tax=Candidatus Taylorbacteria bacterium RIFCSPHIGHO2_01_FULL_46_22b TaxID=1802301 RepID=A0A1G2M158_9BACT|nr:MAG: hypothetical protein A2664_03270 [Candidatus Taylorbacteria bacterium RIFCSPHIGHO2_01_FULL_46_22b]